MRIVLLRSLLPISFIVSRYCVNRNSRGIEGNRLHTLGLGIGV